MPNDPHPEVVQLNLATDQRNAGRDYHEIHLPDSIKVYLATRPSEQLDREAADNERLFAYRFGFDASRAVREQVIAIKQKHDFTDRQMRWLRRSGQMAVKQSGAHLRPADRTMPFFGWLQVGMYSLVFAGVALLITFSAAPAWKQALGLATVATLWFGGTWVLNNLYIAPWRLLRRAGVQ